MVPAGEADTTGGSARGGDAVLSEVVLDVGSTEEVAAVVALGGGAVVGDLLVHMGLRQAQPFGCRLEREPHRVRGRHGGPALPPVLYSHTNLWQTPGTGTPSPRTIDIPDPAKGDELHVCPIDRVRGA